MGNPFSFLNNLNDLVKLAQDEHFQKFLSHPKVQVLMRDKEFEKAVKEKNVLKLMSHEEFTTLLKDPEIVQALEQMRHKFKKSS